MRKIIKLIQLLAFIFICFSCKNSDMDDALGKYEMSITLPEDSTSFVSFSKEGGTETILLTAENKWMANVSNIEDEKWVSIDIKDGEAGENQAIVITTLPNPSFKNRDSEIIVVCGNTPLKVSIRQGSLNDIVVPAGVKTIVSTKDKPDAIVVINSNVDIEIEVSTGVEADEDQWLSCAPTPIGSKAESTIPDGLESQSFTIKTIPNYGIERTGLVIFLNTETEVRDTITVNQENIGTGSFSSTTPTSITGELQEYEITLKSENIEGVNVELAATTGASDWITYDASVNPPKKGTEDETWIYTFQVKENNIEPLTTRNARLTFSDINNLTSPMEINVTQAIKQDKLEITLTDPDPMDMNADWAVENKVTANPFAETIYTFKVITDKVWSVTKTGNAAISFTDQPNNEAATTEVSVEITIPKNPALASSTQREVVLTFISGDHTQTIKIVQADSKVTVVHNANNVSEFEAALKLVSPYATLTNIEHLTISGSTNRLASIEPDIKKMTALKYFNIAKLLSPISNAYIGGFTFKGNTVIEEIVMYDEVTGGNTPGASYIPQNAFQNCIALKSITLSKNMKSIGLLVFDGCPALETIVLKATINKVGFIDSNKAISGVGLGNTNAIPFSNEVLKIYVPNNELDNYNKAKNWSSSNIKVLLTEENPPASLY